MKLYYKDEYTRLFQGDCLEVMDKIIEKGVKFDAIITDPPYGTTQCKWDSIIPLDKMWLLLNKIKHKENSPIILFSSQPFTTSLINSNLNYFKYELIWDKTFGRQPQLANIQPMKRHENILIFGKGKITYNKQMIPLEKPYSSGGASNNTGSNNEHKLGLKKMPKTYTHKTPDSILSFKPVSNSKNVHPTQKPVELIEWLINTYTNENELILDFTCGSGSTLVAAKNLNRKCYGIELEEKYCEITKNRLLA